MLKNQSIIQAAAAAVIVAVPAFFPVAIQASEPQIAPATQPHRVEVEQLLVGESGAAISEARALQPTAKDTKPKAAAANSVESRQLALIVILLSTLGIATRLLWRRHLRAVSLVQDADIDDEMRSN
ncbi:hypothetical protein A7A08_02197 [Methyloligella halotolerans]|uniref:Uncharacterized protein n=2 Tax=Methyloligella halotolerans TaxID=1177755 RepID=A0A1E2RXN4_9HYPH|nr:hypothetical protein A7A08_02197 [Methyloligella halotolerans]